MWNLKKYSKLVNITKKKQIHKYSEQTSAYQWGREGQYRGRKWDVQASGQKTGSRMYCTNMGNNCNIL